MMAVTEGVGAGGEAESATSLEAVKEAAEKLATSVGDTGTFYIGVHDGPHRSYLLKVQEGSIAELHVYTMPKLPRPLVNAIGAGDAVASGTILKWTDSLASSTEECPVDAFRWGLSVGSASCMTSENSMFSLEDAKALYNGIKVERQS
jgi:sugar/nucleoside kinase (ribokinase family)